MRGERGWGRSDLEQCSFALLGVKPAHLCACACATRESKAAGGFPISCISSFLAPAI